MVGPAVATRVKQADVFFRNGVAKAETIVFVVVATLARQRQVARRILPLLAAWPDVLDGETLVRKCRWATTVFAPGVSAADDKVANRLGQSSHGRARL